MPTGVLMFAAHATEMANNPALRLKLALLLVALLNAALFRQAPFRSVAAWDRHTQAPAAARLAAVLSVILWVGVITCGRLIAYF